MDKIVAQIKEASFQVKPKVFKTDSTHACDVLVKYLDTQTMDCLIMGSRNLSGWKRYAFFFIRNVYLLTNLLFFVYGI